MTGDGSKVWCYKEHYYISSVSQFSCSVVSDSLRPHESQHTRPPCPSPTPRVHSDSCPSSQWCHPAISSSVVPFSLCPQSLPASESFPMSQLFAWGGQSTGVSALALFLPRKSQGWSPSEWTGWISLQLWQIDGKTMEMVRDFISWAPKSLQMVTAAMKLKPTCSLEEKLWPSRQHMKKQSHYFTYKGPSIQSYGFSNSRLSMWDLDHKESWTLKNWCFCTVVLEKTHESSLDSREIQPVHPKENHPWIFIGRTDAEAETPILWLPDGKN